MSTSSINNQNPQDSSAPVVDLFQQEKKDTSTLTDFNEFAQPPTAFAETPEKGSTGFGTATSTEEANNGGTSGKLMDYVSAPFSWLASCFSSEGSENPASSTPVATEGNASAEPATSLKEDFKVVYNPNKQREFTKETVQDIKDLKGYLSEKCKTINDYTQKALVFVTETKESQLEANGNYLYNTHMHIENVGREGSRLLGKGAAGLTYVALFVPMIIIALFAPNLAESAMNISQTVVAGVVRGLARATFAIVGHGGVYALGIPALGLFAAGSALSIIGATVGGIVTSPFWAFTACYAVWKHFDDQRRDEALGHAIPAYGEYLKNRKDSRKPKTPAESEKTTEKPNANSSTTPTPDTTKTDQTNTNNAPAADTQPTNNDVSNQANGKQFSDQKNKLNSTDSDDEGEFFDVAE